MSTLVVVIAIWLACPLIAAVGSWGFLRFVYEADEPAAEWTAHVIVAGVFGPFGLSVLALLAFLYVASGVLEKFGARLFHRS